MSIFRISPNDLEKRKVTTSPRRTYVSSSAGVTGSISVFSKVSSIEKDLELRALTDDKNSKNTLIDSGDVTAYNNIVRNARGKRASSGVQNIVQDATDLLTLSRNSFSKRNTEVQIERIVPGDTKHSLFSTNSSWYKKFEKAVMSKLQIKDVLMHYYMASYPTCDWAYTNYHSLNFFNAERDDGVDLPKDSVLLYPSTSSVAPEKSVNGKYSVKGPFTFDFYINPRYKKDVLDSAGEFKAGTIFHLSSSYALSLITGSKKDENGLPLTFRLMLQLSHSTGIAPSDINPETHTAVYPRDLIFFSSDGSLKWNEWHRVIVTWPTKSYNRGRGFFNINGEMKGNFTVPSSSINPLAKPSTGTWPEDPGTLCVGNFFESTGIGTNGISRFFDKEIARGNGVDILNEAGTLKNPSSFNLRHPLKAEVHNLTIRNSYAPSSGSLIKKREGNNPATAKDIIFYVPPFFVERTKMRNKFKVDKSTLIDDGTGILQTPSISRSGRTDDPFNIALALGVGGHYINLENFVKDFANNNWPRLFSLTGSIIDSKISNSQNQTANDYLYKQTSVAKRNLTILPCDDGNYTPGFNLLKNEIVKNKYIDFGGVENYSYVNLDNLISSEAYISQSFGKADVLNPSYENFANDIIGPTPENPLAPQSEKLKNYISKVEKSINDESFDDPGIQQGAPLMIYQRTKDQSSNQITIFNISNIYYGRKIQPESFEITDRNISGSYGQISITLKDDGFGNLYRADSFSTHAKFNSVGNIFYDEGIVVIKSPHLYFFGKNEFEMSFRGLHNVYTTKYELLAQAGTVNSSSNSTYSDAWLSGSRASTDPQDKNEKFVYISDINIHDENMNVIARAKLAQPILKRDRDKILFKIAIDF